MLELDTELLETVDDVVPLEDGLELPLLMRMYIFSLPDLPYNWDELPQSLMVAL